VADKFQQHIHVDVVFHLAVGREFLERMGQTQSSPQELGSKIAVRKSSRCSREEVLSY